MKKQLILSTIISASLAFSASSFADNQDTQQNPSQNTNNAYSDLAKKISDPIVNAINHSFSIKPLTTAVNLIYKTYMTDSNQPNTMQKPARLNNQQILSSQNASNSSSQAASLNFVTAQLAQFPASYHSKDLDYTPPQQQNGDGSYLSYDDQTPATLLQRLEKLSTSDSIIPSSNAGIFSTSSRPVDTSAGNASINFGTLINPNQYDSKDTVTSAQNFISFASQSYQNLADGVNLDDLGGITDTKKRNVATTAITTSDAYKKYLLATRSILAQQSIGYNNLNYLAAQRTGSPSVLASEESKINGRIGTQKWYSDVQAASSATVQRRMLIVLAEIENEMHQNQLLNQRMLATLSMTELQNSQTAKMQLAQQASSLNKKIKACVDSPTSDCASKADPTSVESLQKTQ